MTKARPVVIEDVHSTYRDAFFRQAKGHGLTPAKWFELLVSRAEYLQLALVRRNVFGAPPDIDNFPHDGLESPQQPDIP